MTPPDIATGFRILCRKATRLPGVALLGAAALFAAPRQGRALTITPTFTRSFNANFGANAITAQNAWIAAASVFEANFSDNIHVNITVSAESGTAVFGESESDIVLTSYADLRTAVVADATSADDNLAIGLGGSVGLIDPLAGTTHTWWVTTAQAKALGLMPDDLLPDGTIIFGAGQPFTFFGPIAAGTYDFQGVAEHEMTEVMGRIGLMGRTLSGDVNSYSFADLYTYSGPGIRGGSFGGSCSSSNDQFSIDNGTTLLKQENNYCSNNLDVDDWAPGPDDSFNQFANPGVVNGVSAVDLRQMDVLGYDRVSVGTTTPEPSTLVLLVTGLAGFSAPVIRRRQKRR